MKDGLLYVEFAVFVINVLVMIFLVREQRWARVLVLTALTFFLIVNAGNFNVFTVILSFSTFYALINISANGKIIRLFERVRNGNRRDKQHLQRIHSNNKTMARQKA